MLPPRSRFARGAGPRRESGAALIILLTAVVLIGAATLLDRLSSSASLRLDRDGRTTRALAEAKSALIGWSVSHPSPAANSEPGLLPFPDRAETGPSANYDGNADCVTSGVLANHLIGRYPWRGQPTGGGCEAHPLSVDLRDGSGERLWYAVSRNLVQHRGNPGADPPINTGLLDAADYPWLTVRDRNGQVISDTVAAVVVAPGPPIASQNRSGATPDASNYLDSVEVGGTTYDNSDSDGDFIAFPDTTLDPDSSAAFNDRLAYVTAEQLLRAIEHRAAGEIAAALEAHRGEYGRYPWLSPFRDPSAGGGASTMVGRADAGSGGTTLIDDDADFVTDGITPGDVVYNAARRSSAPVQAVVGANELTLTGNLHLFSGSSYAIRPGFDAVWGVRVGHVAFYDENATEAQDLSTGFTVTWSNGDTASSSCDESLGGSLVMWLPAADCVNIVLPAVEAAATDGSITQPDPATTPPGGDEAQCSMTSIDDADCTPVSEPDSPVHNVTACIDVFGIVTCIPFPLPVARTVTIQQTGGASVRVVGTGSVTDPPAGVVKRRSVTGGTGTPEHTVTVTDRVVLDLGLLGTVNATLATATATVEPAPSEDDAIAISGIYMDLEEGDLEDGHLPGWIVDNEWYRFVAVAMSAALSPDGTPSCVPGPTGNCLAVDYVAGEREDVDLVVIGAAATLAGQVRPSDDAAQYFEIGNAVSLSMDQPTIDPYNPDDDVFGRGATTTDFNDQLYVLPASSAPLGWGN